MEIELFYHIKQNHLQAIVEDDLSVGADWCLDEYSPHAESLLRKGKMLEFKLPPKRKFFEICNCIARKRIFCEGDYKNFYAHLRKARRKSLDFKPYYMWDHAGSVANNYRYTTYTARWGVWVSGYNLVTISWDRVAIKGRHVAQPYYFGDRAYQSWHKAETERIRKGLFNVHN